MASAMSGGGGAALRPVGWLLGGLAVALLAVAALIGAQLPPRATGRIMSAAAPVQPAMTEAEERAARARVAQALIALRRHSVAQRLAEADAVLAAVHAATDPDAVARWQAEEAAASTLPPVDLPPPLLELAPPLALLPEPTMPLAIPAQEHALPIDEPPPVLALAAPMAPVEAPPLPLPLAPPAPAVPALARVFIHHAGDARDARALAGLLPHGLVLAEVRLVRATPTRPDIRYFHQADRAAADALAARLAQRLALRLPVRDFTHYRPLPLPGTIELWLAQP